MRWLRKGRIRFLRGQRGISLIETLVGLALLGIITGAFLSGLFTISKAVGVNQESVAAESLAKSQIEYIRVQDYIAVVPDDPNNRYEIIDISADLAAAGYSVETYPPETILSEAGGYELQKTTVAVKRDGKAELVVSIYRVSD